MNINFEEAYKWLEQQKQDNEETNALIEYIQESLWRYEDLRNS